MGEMRTRKKNVVVCQKTEKIALSLTNAVYYAVYYYAL